MAGSKLSQLELKQIIHLRQTGHSLAEIKKITGRAKSTLSLVVRGIPCLPAFQHLIDDKRRTMQVKAARNWQEAKAEASKRIQGLNQVEKLLIAACLYWGEGTKRELSLVNTDPYLLRVFISCLVDLGIDIKRIQLGLRIFEDMNEEKVKEFWSSWLDVPISQFVKSEIRKGRKSGKLEYGMCRMRVKKGADYYKLLMSSINQIQELFKPL